MHFPPLNFTDPGFNPAYTDDFKLLIILNRDTFSYAVLHSATEKLVRISTGNPLAQLWDWELYADLASAYQKVILAVETNSFCMIPNAVFTPENLVDFAAFLAVKEADVILTDQVENGQNTVIFTFSREIITQLENRFNHTKIEFAPKSWIKTVFQEKNSGQNLYLFLEENRLKVLFPYQENIQFYNQFECSDLDELIYFTALVEDQLQLKPEETSLLICGGVVDKSDQMLRLKEFFKDVKLCTNDNFTQKNELQYHQIVQFLGLS